MDRILEEELTAVALAILQDGPEAPWQALVEAGAAIRGVAPETIEELAVTMFRAADVALNETAEQRRRDVCKRIAFSAMDTLCALASAGCDQLEAA